MHRTLLCGLILLAAPDGADPRPAPPFCRPRLEGAAEEAPVSAATFQCPRVDTDGTDARFCCGPCASPSCCPSEEEARLHQEQCLLAESSPPTPIWPEEGPGTALATATNATTSDGEPDSTAAQVAAIKGGVNAANNSSVAGSVQRQHQLNGLYFCLGTLGLLAVFYIIYYGIIGRKYPMSTNSEDGDYNGSQPPLFSIEDLEGLGQRRSPAASPNEYIEMQDFAGRPRRDSGLSDRFNPFFAARPPPPYDDDPPPPYSEHATFPLARIDWMSGVARRKNQQCGHDNVGYCEEGGTGVPVGLNLSHPRRGSDLGVTMEQETELTTTAALESHVEGTGPNVGEVLAVAAASAGPVPEVDGGGSLGAVVLPEGDRAAVAPLAT